MLPVIATVKDGASLNFKLYQIHEQLNNSDDSKVKHQTVKFTH